VATQTGKFSASCEKAWGFSKTVRLLPTGALEPKIGALEHKRALRISEPLVFQGPCVVETSLCNLEKPTCTLEPYVLLVMFLFVKPTSLSKIEKM